MTAGAGGCQLGLFDQGDLFDQHDAQVRAGSWASALADVAPSPQPSRGAPLRAASGRLSGSAGVVTPAEMPQGAKR